MPAAPVGRLSWWALRRSGESICTFVRDFDTRGTEEDLQIDSEGMGFSVLPDIAYRSEFSLEGTEKNPFYDRVKTVRNLVDFLEHQPRLRGVEQAGAANAG